jgi:putative transcriptional regulator
MSMDNKNQVELPLEKGILLLAEPFMADPGFKRAAVLLSDYGKEGAVGFILNKPLHIPVHTLISDFPEVDNMAYYGGPVANDTLHYVHNIGHILDESLEIGNGVYWGGNFSQLKALIRQGLVQQDNIQFFVGYSGWSTGQLEEEMEVQSWVKAPFHPEYVFGNVQGDLWKNAMNGLGASYSILADMPEQTNWN